jgi:hypothetical protein
MIIIAEPLFFGERTRTQGCTAEEFIDRVDSRRITNGWNDQATVARARGFLRDAAHAWSEYALESIYQFRPNELEVIRTTWAGFRRVFQETYFAINQSSDLAVDWTNLRQLPTEDALGFANRVAGILYRYQKLLGTRPSPERERITLSEAIEELHQADPGAATRRQIDALTEAMTAYANANQATGQATVVHNLQTRMVVDGITDSKIKLAVKKRELEGAAFHEITETIRMATKAQAGRITTANKEFRSNTEASKPVKTTAVTTADSSDEDEAETAAVVQRARDKKKAKKDRKKQAKAQEQAAVAAPAAADKQKKKRFDFSKPPPADETCFHCHRPGHWARHCPFQKQMMAEFMQRQSCNVTNAPGNGAGDGYAGSPQGSGNASAGWF